MNYLPFVCYIYQFDLLHTLGPSQFEPRKDSFVLHPELFAFCLLYFFWFWFFFGGDSFLQKKWQKKKMKEKKWARKMEEEGAHQLWDPQLKV